MKCTKLQLGVIKLLIVGSDQFIYLLIKPEVCSIRIVYSGYGGGLNQLLMFWTCLMYLLI